MVNLIVYFLMWMTCTSCSFIDYDDDNDRDKEIKDLAEMVEEDVTQGMVKSGIKKGTKVTEL